MKFINLSESIIKNIALAGLMSTSAISSTASQSHTDVSRMNLNYSDDSIITYTSKFTSKAEGFKEYIYYDTKGIPTIGHGFNLNEVFIQKYLTAFGYNVEKLKNKNEKISEKDSIKLLSILLKQSLNDAKKYLNENNIGINFDNQPFLVRFILTDMSYNMGYTKLNKFKKLKAALIIGDYNTASKEMKNSKWYSDVGNRSKKLIKIMKSI